MNHLLYNITFDIAGLALILSVLVIHIITYRYSSKNNRAFQIFLCASLFDGAAELLTAFAVSYAQSVPDSLNMALHILHCLSACGLAYFGMRYVFSCVGFRSRISTLANRSVWALYALFLLADSQTGVTVSFQNHAYVKGPLFFIGYFVPLFFVVHAGVVMFRHRKRFSSRQLSLNCFYVMIPCFAAAFQPFRPDIPVTYFASTLSALFMIFSLETEDYQRFQIAMRDLEEAKAAAMSANRAKSDFLARMSHEIRTPINGILGMNGMILKESDNAEIREYAENIDSAGRGLLALINDILDLSKIESGKMRLVPVSYHLSSVVNDCYHMIAQQAKEKGLFVNTDIDPSLPYQLYGDEVRIRQIIVNLLTNATKYTEKGGITFSVSGTVRQGEKGKILDLTLRVQDTGIGIREEEQKRLFEAFARADEVRNRYIEGTGLGLRITAQLVDLMGGKIDLESEYGKGSAFTVTVPQLVQGEAVVGNLDVASAAEERAAHEEKKIFTAPDMSVLVVDDVELNLKVVRGFLKESKIQIDAANSGAQCLQMVTRKRYDIILLDHMMPDMDGLETFQKMRAMEHSLNLKTPVIMMTANAIVGAREEYLQFGFDDYLSKPIMEADLVRVISAHAKPELVQWFSEEPKNAAERHSADGAEDADGAGWLDKLAFLDTKSALLFCANNPEFYREMLRSFVAENRMGQIQACFSQEDWKNYAIQAHSLKGTAKIIGAKELAELAFNLEMAAKREDVNEIRRQHGACMICYGELRQKLSMLLMR